MNQSLAAGLILLCSLSTFSVAHSTISRAKWWLCWTLSSRCAFLVLAWPQWWLRTSTPYLPPCGAQCHWQRRSAGVCGLPSHLVETPARTVKAVMYNCRCDRGKSLSPGLFVWPWTWPKDNLNNEANTRLSDAGLPGCGKIRGWGD